MIMQMQQEAENRRRQEEAAAKAKADADAAAAKAAEEQRQAQIANQRQKDAQSAQDAEAARQAALSKRAGPVDPADSYSPVSGSFYGSATAGDQSRQVGSIPDYTGGQYDAFLKNAQAQGSMGSVSDLGSMFGAATKPKQPQGLGTSLGSSFGGAGNTSNAPASAAGMFSGFGKPTPPSVRPPQQGLFGESQGQQQQNPQNQNAPQKPNNAFGGQARMF